ncbi:alpha/beta hydrolase [Paenibacillus tyrfis]|uniref:alpha/beta hydrolase n=1 Tax=Paenibacillus tyrfis TaxID=1501230 RepID=UPI00209CAD6C|nr:alpha/beta hydrolase [Paenibacillus tyrfis]MCP1308754.1 alpha/beta hydrolase [Paenibacillus tyrfis]
MHKLTPEEIRKVVIATAILETYDLASTETLELSGPHGPLAVRLYRPSNESSLPVILFFHGGGFVFTTMEQYDPMCSKLAAVSDCAVLSVDYRLSPENPFPVPVEEALFAAAWLGEHAASLGLDPTRIIVSGESAGANLAAVVAQRAGKDGVPNIAYQILLCPLTDWSGEYESKETYGTGYFLTKALLDYCAGHYLGEWNRKNPLASPLFGETASLAAALVVTAEYDPLRDEGERYAHKMIESGVKVTLKRYPGMIHLFYAMTDVFPDGNDVYDLIRRQLRTLQ